MRPRGRKDGRICCGSWWSAPSLSICIELFERWRWRRSVRLFRYADTQEFQRREFLRLAGMGIGVMATGGFRMLRAAENDAASAKSTADSVIFVYIGGGQAASETWDPKRYTPFEKGIKAEDVYSTFPAIPTSADGIQLSQGMEQLASVMHKGTVIPSCKPGDLG